MRAFFVALFALMAALSLFMGIWSAPHTEPGKTPLVWTSDPNPTRAEQVQLFNRLNPDIALTVDPANESMDKVIVQSIGGIGPDLFDCRDANQLSAYVKAGIALDVTDDLAAMGIDVEKQTWKAMHPMAIHEGRVYGIPTNVAANALWFNKELLEREGIQMPKAPWKWEQLIPLAQKLTKRDRDGKLIQAGLLLDWYNWPHFVYTFGGRMFSADGTKCVVDSPECINAVQLMQDLVYKYKVTPSPVEEAGMAAIGGFGSDNMNVFGAKRAAMALNGRWWLVKLRDFEGLRLGVMESPNGGVRACSTTGRATLINARSPNKKLALRFLKYMASREYNELINAQADGICPFKEFAKAESFLHDPKHPEERYNDVWREASELAVPSQTSPFVNGQLANRIIDIQIDLVRIGQKPAKDALRDAARLVNAEIAKTIAEFPELRARYYAAQAATTRSLR